MADFVDTLFWKGSYESFSNTVTYTSFDVRYLVLLLVCFALHQWFKWSRCCHINYDCRVKLISKVKTLFSKIFVFEIMKETTQMDCF